MSAFAVLHNVQYEASTSIRPLAKLQDSTIGKCSSIGSMSAVYDSTIGNFCSIARECYIGGARHPLDWVSTSGCFYLKSNFTGVCYHESDFNWHSSVRIGNDVWLGVRVIVLGGVTIGDGAVIGAGSVVTKNVGPYEIWAGNPARLIRKRFDEATIEMLLKTKWWDWDDDTLKKKGALFPHTDLFLAEVACKNQGDDQN